MVLPRFARGGRGCRTRGVFVERLWEAAPKIKRRRGLTSNKMLLQGSKKKVVLGSLNYPSNKGFSHGTTAIV